LRKTREIIGSGPEIGNVYFNGIDVGVGNVYFNKEFYVLTRHFCYMKK